MNLPTPSVFAIVSSLCASLLWSVAPAKAATIIENFTGPVSDNGFSVISNISPTDGRGVSFNTTAPGTMTVAYLFEVGDVQSAPWSSMSRAFTGNAGANWSMSTNFNISGMAFSNSTAGITAMSSTANFGGTVYSSLGYSARVFVDFNDTIQLRIYGPGSELTLVDNNNVGTVSSSLLTLNFTGSYNAQGDLALNASLFNGVNEMGNISHTVLQPNVMNGDYFGTYVGKRFGNNPGTVVFDSLEITAIPEPSTTAFFTAGLGLILFMRRKHHRA